MSDPDHTQDDDTSRKSIDPVIAEITEIRDLLRWYLHAEALSPDSSEEDDEAYSILGSGLASQQDRLRHVKLVKLGMRLVPSLSKAYVALSQCSGDASVIGPTRRKLDAIHLLLEPLRVLWGRVLAHLDGLIELLQGCKEPARPQIRRGDVPRKTLGERLWEARLRKRDKQETVAYFLECTVSTVCRIENGKRDVAQSGSTDSTGTTAGAPTGPLAAAVTCGHRSCS